MFLLIRFTNCQVLYSRSYLNSIMFLLIPTGTIYRKLAFIDLNSIMFLLIHVPYVWSLLTAVRFKFHYVSINSKHVRKEVLQLDKFKFHYVSINSCFLAIISLLLIYLNSIMFLLIRIFWKMMRRKNKI